MIGCWIDWDSIPEFVEEHYAIAKLYDKIICSEMNGDEVAAQKFQEEADARKAVLMEKIRSWRTDQIRKEQTLYCV